MIKKLKEEHIDKIIELLKNEITEIDEEKFRTEINNGLVWESNCKILGFINISSVDKEKKSVHLIIYVSKNHRKSGIGSKLYFEAINLINYRDIKSIQTEVRVEKDNTCTFFIEHGFSKWFSHQTMDYKGGIINSSLKLATYKEEFYDQYKAISEECFYEMRKSLNIKPHRVCSSSQDLNKIKDKNFLLLNADTAEIIGSVALLNNEIDELIVNKKYQGQGYGKKLLNFGINYFQTKNETNIFLRVARWNKKAMNLYEKSGFEVATITEVLTKKI